MLQLSNLNSYLRFHILRVQLFFDLNNKPQHMLLQGRQLIEQLPSYTNPAKLVKIAAIKAKTIIAIGLPLKALGIGARSKRTRIVEKI